jgi:hypothetical protein
MPNTTNFNWPTPADTDLVKDGAAAIRNLGDGVDTSLVDLKGGTTGQILSKASNADMDFAFITPNVGDLTEVQAGTGISVADGTGPIPIVTNTVATAFDAKGDLVVGTGADTFAKLTVGTDGHTLVADSVEATGLKWVAPAAGGKVLQVVEGTLTTEVSSSSSALADTGLTATITPSSASNKILVFVSLQGVRKSPGNAANQIQFALLRGATTINGGLGLYTNSTLDLTTPSASFIVNDAPATTSATTYKVQFANYNNTASVSINYNTSFVSTTSTILLMEVTP